MSVDRPKGEVVIALAGNPNVGKSSLFNSITGLGVQTAHYPGTTRAIHTAVARAGDRVIGVVDLPGTYDLNGSTEADSVAVRALEDLQPDAVVIVVDPSALARNLYLVLEAIDRGLPVVVAVNLVDEARRAGITTDVGALAGALGVPVVETVAVRGQGVADVVNAAIASAGTPVAATSYSRDFEALIEPLVSEIASRGRSESARIRALGLLEQPAGSRETESADPHALAAVHAALKSHFGEASAQRIARERHLRAGAIAEAVVKRTDGGGGRLPRDAWSLTTWPWTGVPLVAVVAAGIFGFLFLVGDLLAGWFSAAWSAFASPGITSLVTALAGEGTFAKVLLWGFDAGIEASLAIGLPYILTFYFLLGLLEDTGYLNSLAFLTDRVMHRFGLHGRAIVPLIAAAGCNVPALVAAGQLPSKRERRIASTLVLFVPCSARTAVILGSVGHFLGWQPALLVLAILAALWLTLGLALQRMLPGSSRGLVMEMFTFRRPSLRRVAAKAWEQFREFLFVATPIVVVGSLVLGGLYETGWLLKLSGFLAPVVEGWLGLPAIAGLTLLLGFLRKELALQLLVALAAATAGFAGASIMELMSPTDIVVFALVNAIALPCISSVTVYWKRHGWGPTAVVITASIGIALIIGGAVARILGLVGFGA